MNNQHVMYGQKAMEKCQKSEPRRKQSWRLVCALSPRTVVAALALGVSLSGCAVNMAATGRDGPDLNVVRQEATRLDVERQLGSAVRTQQMGDGEYIAVYDVEPRTKSNMARAAGHGVLDLFTFGLWEVVGGPLEAANARRVLVTARYNKSDKLIELTSKAKPVL